MIKIEDTRVEGQSWMTELRIFQIYLRGLVHKHSGPMRARCYRFSYAVEGA